MAITNIDHLYDLHEDVASLLREEGVAAERWHSGGGIYGVQIERPSTGSYLFSDLDSDGGSRAWIGFDYNDRDGGLIANIELNTRPYDVDPKYGFAATASEMVADILHLLAHLA